MDGRDQIPSPLELFVEHWSTLLVVDETYPSQIKKTNKKPPTQQQKPNQKKKKKEVENTRSNFAGHEDAVLLYKSVWFAKIISIITGFMHQTKIPFQAIILPNRKPSMPFKT